MRLIFHGGYSVGDIPLSYRLSGACLKALEAPRNRSRSHSDVVRRLQSCKDPLSAPANRGSHGPVGRSPLPDRRVSPLFGSIVDAGRYQYPFHIAHSSMLRSALLVTLTVAVGIATAQAQEIPIVTITGTVTEAETGAALPGAHVFVASSMLGTTTAADGTYRLEGVPIGALRLYVSMVGFDPEARDMLLRTAAVRVVDFELKPSVVEVGEVIVEAKRDKKWKQRLERFKRLFIGETPNAAETQIVNPEVLDFESSGGEFRAIASQPLVIENRALGYRVQYFLKDFVAEPTRTRYDGEPLFEELIPESEEEAGRWEVNRRNAFIGSFRHFLLAMLAGRTDEQQFMTYARTVMGSGSPGEMPGNPTSGTRFPIKPDELFKPGETPNERVLEFDGFTEIIFKGEYEDESYLEWSRAAGRRPKYQTSWIRLERGPAVFDYKGDVLDPYGVTFYGYLAFERVADEVPKEYRPR